MKYVALIPELSAEPRVAETSSNATAARAQPLVAETSSKATAAKARHGKCQQDANPTMPTWSALAGN